MIYNIFSDCLLSEQVRGSTPFHVENVRRSYSESQDYLTRFGNTRYNSYVISFTFKFLKYISVYTICINIS